jgi:hypothetical protein
VNETVLNALISNNCPSRLTADRRVQLHIFDLHCNKMWVIVTKVGKSYSYAYVVSYFWLQGMRTDKEMYDLVNSKNIDWM